MGILQTNKTLTKKHDLTYELSTTPCTQYIDVIRKILP